MGKLPKRYQKQLDEVMKGFRKKIITVTWEDTEEGSELEIIAATVEKIGAKIIDHLEAGLVTTAIDAKLKNGKVIITIWGSQPERFANGYQKPIRKKEAKK